MHSAAHTQSIAQPHGFMKSPLTPVFRSLSSLTSVRPRTYKPAPFRTKNVAATARLHHSHIKHRNASILGCPLTTTSTTTLVMSGKQATLKYVRPSQLTLRSAFDIHSVMGGTSNIFIAASLASKMEVKPNHDKPGLSSPQRPPRRMATMG